MGVWIGLSAALTVVLAVTTLASGLLSHVSVYRAYAPPQHKLLRKVYWYGFLGLYGASLGLLYALYRHVQPMTAGWRLGFVVLLWCYLTMGSGNAAGKRRWWVTMGWLMALAMVLTLLHMFGLTHVTIGQKTIPLG